MNRNCTPQTTCLPFLSPAAARDGLLKLPFGRIRARAVKTMIRTCLCGLLLAVRTLALFGQQFDRPPAYSAILLRLGGMHQHVDDRLAQYYAPGTGISADVSTPFEVGEVGITLERASYHGVAPGNHPDFHGTSATLHWRAPAVRLGRVSAALGVHSGAMQFSFNDPTVVEGLRAERELIMGVNAIARFDVGRHVSVWGSAEYSHVWLHVPVHLEPLSAGLQYDITTPAWLKGFLE